MKKEQLTAWLLAQDQYICACGQKHLVWRDEKSGRIIIEDYKGGIQYDMLRCMQCGADMVQS